MSTGRAKLLLSRIPNAGQSLRGRFAKVPGPLEGWLIVTDEPLVEFDADGQPFVVLREADPNLSPQLRAIVQCSHAALLDDLQWVSPEKRVELLKRHGWARMVGVGANSPTTSSETVWITGDVDSWWRVCPVAEAAGRLLEFAPHEATKLLQTRTRENAEHRARWVFALFDVAEQCESLPLLVKSGEDLLAELDDYEKLQFRSDDVRWVLSLFKGFPTEFAVERVARLPDLMQASALACDFLAGAVEAGEGETAEAGGEAAQTKQVAHSDDFRFVQWFGETYRFTATQAACVRILWENWERGTPEVGETILLEKAGSEGNRLRDVFRKGQHPAWEKLIVPGSTKGSWRLAKPKI